MDIILGAFLAVRIGTIFWLGDEIEVSPSVTTMVGQDICSGVDSQVSLSQGSICYHHIEEPENACVEDNVHDHQLLL